MAKYLLKLTLILIIAFRMTGIGACTQSAKARLDPASPVTIACWHYYNGVQLANFDRLVQTFNETAGQQEGIQVNANSQGNNRDLAEAIQTAFASRAGDQPDIFATYPGTAYEFAAAGRLVDLNKYLNTADLDKFHPGFLAEGRFSSGGMTGLYILPIAKSSEVVALNLTDWQSFAADNPRYADPTATFSTWESISQAAEAYQNWSGGKAMIGFDSLANFIIAGSRQSGISLIDTTAGKVAINLDREALRQIWNIYYVGIVQGSWGAPGDYRADDLASGDLIAGVVSTASGTWLPDHVASVEGRRPIELTVLPYPAFRDGEPVCIQQGAGMAVTRSDASHEAAAAIFLDWLIRPEQNVSFAIGSSYLPVTGQALQSQLLRDSIRQVADGGAVPAAAQCLDVFLRQISTQTLYFPGAFHGSDRIRSYLEKSLMETARAARQNWLCDQQSNIAADQLKTRYFCDAAFESWYSAIILGTDQILKTDSD